MTRVSDFKPIAEDEKLSKSATQVIKKGDSLKHDGTYLLLLKANEYYVKGKEKYVFGTSFSVQGQQRKHKKTTETRKS